MSNLSLGSTYSNARGALLAPNGKGSKGGSSGGVGIGDVEITLPNLAVDVDWALTKNQGATLAIKNKPTTLGDFYQQQNNPFKIITGVPPTDGAKVGYVQVDALDATSYLSAPSLSGTAKIQTAAAGNLQDFNGNPLFATVASTGSYTDLLNKPIGQTQLQWSYDMLQTATNAQGTDPLFSGWIPTRSSYFVQNTTPGFESTSVLGFDRNPGQVKPPSSVLCTTITPTSSGMYRIEWNVVFNVKANAVSNTTFIAPYSTTLYGSHSSLGAAGASPGVNECSQLGSCGCTVYLAANIDTMVLLANSNVDGNYLVSSKNSLRIIRLAQY